MDILSTFVQILVICVCSSDKVSGIICYKCNESKRSPSDNCQSQAAFSCSDRNSAGRGGGIANQQSLLKIICRTTRTKIRQNLFSIVKDCTTEDEHLNRFHNGKAFGCETVYLNGTQEVTYCVCDQDQCNEKDIDEQIAEDEKLDSFLDTGDNSDENGQIKFMPAPTPINLKNSAPPPSVPGISQRDRSRESSREIPSPPIVRLSNDTILLPPNPIDVLTPSPTVKNAIQNLGLLQQTNQQPQFSFIQQQQRLTTKFSGPVNEFSVNDQWQQSFNCSFCDEIILQPNTDCQRKTVLDCKKQLTTQDGKYFCYTKDTLLRTGEHRIEKRCTTDEIAQREIGVGGGGAARNICGQTHAGSPFEFQYCICASPSCNSPALQNQQLLLQSSAATPTPKPLDAITYPELQLRTALPQPQTTASSTTGAATTLATTTPINIIARTSTENNAPSLKCYVCGESDSKIAECTQQYKYDCKRQYPTPTSDDKMLCLTRKTKGANGLNYIEKRCIMQSEHQTQYPNAKEPVVAKGCGQAWEGYVEYCVCERDFCNDKSLGDQQSGDPSFVVTSRRETMTTGAASGELSREIESPPQQSLSTATATVVTVTTETTKTTTEGTGGRKEEHKQESDEPVNESESISQHQNLLLLSFLMFAVRYVI